MPSLISMSMSSPEILSSQNIEPDYNGNISFNLNDLASNLSSVINNPGYSSTDNNIENNMWKLKITHYILLIIIGILFVLYIFKHKNILYEIITSGFILTSVKYPLIPIASFIVNMSLTVWFIHKNYKKTMENLNKNIFIKKTKNEVKNNEKLKTIWTDISDKCNSNLDNVFKNIVNDFQNEDINKNYNSPLSKYLILDDTEKDKIITRFNENYKLDIKDWKEKIKLITNIFSEKYRKYKNIENELLDIKNKMKDLKEWSTSTETLFKDLKENNEILKKNVEDYVKKKIVDMNYPNMIEEYQILYTELKVILKFLENNPETETLSKCAICLTNLKNSFIVPCGHCACKDCLDAQYKIDKKIICPICRTDGTKISKLFY